MIGLHNAEVRFGTRTVLGDLSFTVPLGRTLAILGPNGRGKTTALRALLGFQKLHHGHRTAPPVVGYVPQNTSTTHRYSVLDIVVMGQAARLGLFGQPQLADRKVALAALEQLGLIHFAETSIDRLSGGERQLVLLARALATGSPALVLDEPGAALDLKNQHRLLGIIDGLRQQRSKAIIFTTHDPNHALAAADDVLLMLPDAATLHGPTAQMMTPPHLERLYGVPMRLVDLTGADGLPRRAVLPAFAGTEHAA